MNRAGKVVKQQHGHEESTGEDNEHEKLCGSSRQEKSTKDLTGEHDRKRRAVEVGEHLFS
jgi:hypothetical protein